MVQGHQFCEIPYIVCAELPVDSQMNSLMPSQLPWFLLNMLIKCLKSEIVHLFFFLPPPMDNVF